MKLDFVHDQHLIQILFRPIYLFIYLSIIYLSIYYYYYLLLSIIYLFIYLFIYCLFRFVC